MTRKEIINEALKNNEVELDTAGLILGLGNEGIRKCLEREYIKPEFTNKLLAVEE